MKTAKAHPALLLVFLLLLPALNLQASKYAMDQRLYERIQRVQTLIDEDRLTEAERLLEQMENRRLNPYEAAQLLNLSGFIDTQQEQYESAVASYQAIVAAEEIPPGLRQGALRMLVQLNMTLGAYEKTIDYVEQLVQESEQVNASTLAIKAQAHFRLKQYEQALAPIEQAIALQTADGSAPRENWLLLMNAIHHQLSDYDAMETVLQRLLRHYPKDRYLYNLAAVYGQLDQPKKQLLLLEPLYESGFLQREAQVIHLAHLYMSHDVPDKAARLLDWALQEEILAGEPRHLELIAQAWLAARETGRAIEPLSLAASNAQTGDLYVRLAHLHIGRSDWAAAEESLRKALEKGDLKDQGNALVLMGMAQYHQKRYVKAIDTFQRARSHTNVDHVSEQWITFIEQERRKRDMARG